MDQAMDKVKKGSEAKEKPKPKKGVPRGETVDDGQGHKISHAERRARLRQLYAEQEETMRRQMKEISDKQVVDYARSRGTVTGDKGGKD